MSIFLPKEEEQQQSPSRWWVLGFLHSVVNSSDRDEAADSPLEGPREAACRSLEQPRPDPACNETEQSWEGNPPADLLKQRTKWPAASCHASPSSVVASHFLFFFLNSRGNMKRWQIIMLGQWPCGARCKYIHLFIHLFNVYRKLAMCLVPCKVFGMQCYGDTRPTRGPS